jgi:hypothetical protein
MRLCAEGGREGLYTGKVTVGLCTGTATRVRGTARLHRYVYSVLPSSLILEKYLYSVFPSSTNIGYCNILSFTLKWLINRESTNGIKLSN